MRVVWFGETASEEVRREPGEPEGIVLSGKAIEVGIDVRNRSDECCRDRPNCTPCLNPDLAPDLARDDILARAAVKTFVSAAPQPD